MIWGEPGSAPPRLTAVRRDGDGIRPDPRLFTDHIGRTESRPANSDPSGHGNSEPEVQPKQKGLPNEEPLQLHETVLAKRFVADAKSRAQYPPSSQLKR